MWLDRVLAARGDLHTAEVMFAVAVDQNALELAERAARQRCAIVPGTRCRLALATVLSRAQKPKDVIAQLHDVVNWGGARRDQIAAWFLLCDAFVASAADSEGLLCLRRLESSGLVKPTDPELLRRLNALKPAARPTP
jgi:hypothetical protein